MLFTDLVFDLYGTLVDIHTEEDAIVWEKTALFFGFYGARYTGPELKTAFTAAMAAKKATAGQTYECFPDLPFEPVMAQLFRDKGVADRSEALGFQAAQLFRIASMDYIRLYPGVQNALKALKQYGYRLWLLTNAQRVFTAYELRLLGLEDTFDGVYISSDFGCRKPDQRFFRALLEEQNLDPAKCLMIGNDRTTDIAGAQQAGLATLYLHTDLTPADQKAANPAMLLGAAPENCRHWEFECADWNVLTELLCSAF